jgi:hypothetical protein
VWGGRPAQWIPVVLIGLGLTGAYGLFLVAWALRLRRQAGVLRDQRVRLGERAAYYEDRSKRLSAQVELLSAMREVSRIVNDEVRFDRILDESLRIVQDLVDSESITIFLINERTGTLEAAAHRGGDRVTRFGKDLPPGAIDFANVEECLEHHTILRTVERDWLTLSVPLDADQEPVGVIKITVPLALDFASATPRTGAGPRPTSTSRTIRGRAGSSAISCTAWPRARGRSATSPSRPTSPRNSAGTR